MSKSKIEQIREFLSTNFETSVIAGSIASNTTVSFNRREKTYKVGNITGSFEHVMQLLKEMAEA